MVAVASLHLIQFPPPRLKPTQVEASPAKKPLNARRIACKGLHQDFNRKPVTDGGDEELEDLGVKVALSMLKFYKREISPLLPSSCRYLPSCSEYSMQAYKKYGVAKGTILTAWRLCRCNPFGGSGYDPPRWFDEPKPPEG